MKNKKVDLFIFRDMETKKLIESVGKLVTAAAKRKSLDAVNFHCFETCMYDVRGFFITFDIVVIIMKKAAGCLRCDATNQNKPE